MKDGGGLELAGGAFPGIEEIGSPAVRSEQHRLASLPVRVAVKARVVQCHAEECAGREGVSVREAYGSAFPVEVGTSGLRNQRGDIGALGPLRKNVQRYGHNLFC